MDQLTKRIASAWHRHGFSGFVYLVGKNIYLTFRNIVRQPSKVLRGAREDSGLQSFDAAYGTETSAIREVGSLDIASPNARHAVRYQPSSDALVRNAISRLEIDPTTFTFVDFGSGKGRVLMVAAEYPFKQIIGVEFSPELNAIAKRNIARLPPDLNHGGRISTLCCDAAEFEPPPSALVCYFYNPFGAAVLAPIADRLAARAVQGHRTIIIYVDPQNRELFDKTGRFKTLHADRSLLVLDT
jgi:SAM-dependent methyltransferase